ncbi:hypothetical protein BC834DRAFT_1041800 [Gloeopeniophorella convolvens]|nr:hypothetical protein BC834DRAFT_1041800 [Gloeopeniophorella convolvens]
MPATLLSLPLDVLLSIRDAVSTAPFTLLDPGLALLAHLSLSQTCRRLRTLYAFATPESEDLFWKRACVIAGYGRPMRREYPHALPGAPPPGTTTAPALLTWRQVAHAVTAHKRVCEIRSCRAASCWPDDCPPRGAAALAFHPLFYYLHFAPGTELDPAAVLHTQLPTHPDCRRKLYAPLSAHASAACALATSPPVRALTLLHPGTDRAIASVRNPDGCTLLDANRLLGDLLPRSLADMRTVLSHYQTLLDDYRAPAASFADTMRGAAHRGVMGDHRYPYLDLAPEDIERPDTPDTPLGPFVMRCEGAEEGEDGGFCVEALFGVLVQK